MEPPDVWVEVKVTSGSDIPIGRSPVNRRIITLRQRLYLAFHENIPYPRSRLCLLGGMSCRRRTCARSRCRHDRSSVSKLRLRFHSRSRFCSESAFGRIHIVGRFLGHLVRALPRRGERSQAVAEERFVAKGDWSFRRRKSRGSSPTGQSPFHPLPCRRWGKHVLRQPETRIHPAELPARRKRNRPRRLHWCRVRRSLAPSNRESAPTPIDWRRSHPDGIRWDR